ncbi:NADH-quinone oxidoreductase subunit NuoE [Hirschia litorea]|uniref:NADH-quinone oxidoreductase subunit NuoE n=1 Tax=Hirschia litorea TaxID=1199156 RepID=A0ABW2IHM3_9PROT
MSSIRRFDIEAGGSEFTFKAETEEKIQFWLSKYPVERQRSAVIPMLWLAQKDNAGWLSEPAMREVAERLGMAYIRVYEVATFYTMFRMQPVGEFHIQVCGTTPCMLRGSDDLISVCKSKIGDKGHVGANGKLSWEEVECLGACVNAPMAQVNDYYYEDLDADSMGQLLDELVAGKNPKPGTRVDRQTSAPEGGLTSLLDESLYDGSLATPLKTIPGAPESEKEEVVASSNGATELAPQKVKEDKSSANFGDTKTFASKDVGNKPSLEDEARPSVLAEPLNGSSDDLKRISGIGPKIEETLNSLGVFHFAQIAEWTEENVDWIDAFLSFKGRVERENWISQSKLLAAGEETEFSQRQSKTEAKKD